MLELESGVAIEVAAWSSTPGRYRSGRWLDRASARSAAMPSASRPSWARMRSGLPWGMNRRRARRAPRRGTSGAIACTWSAIVMPMPPSRMPSSTVTTTPVARRRRRSSPGRAARTQRTSHTVASMPCVGQRGGGLLGGVDHLADGEDAHASRRRARSRRAGRPDADLVLADLRRRAVRVADRHRAVVGELDARRAASRCSSCARRRREHRHARHLGEQRHVEHAVVADGPSSPVMPARSRQNTTGRRCRATS